MESDLKFPFTLNNIKCKSKHYAEFQTFQSGAFLHGLCMFLLCLCVFSQFSGFFPETKSMHGVQSTGDSKLAVRVNGY